MSKYVSLLSISALLTGCVETEPQAPVGESEQSSIRIALVLGATGMEFSGEQQAGALAAVRDLGPHVDLAISGPAQINPGEEVWIFQNAASTLPDAIIVAPIPPSLFTEPALQAIENGIPVAYLMSPPSAGVDEALFVGQKEYEVGRRVANLVADRIGLRFPNTAPADISGTIVTGTCVPGMENLDDRMQGVREGLAERLPNVRVPPDMNTGNERGSTFALWQQAVQANSDALAFLGACENDLVNLSKIKEDDGRDFEMVAFDTPEAVRNSIKQGTIASAVPPSHFTSAYMAVWIVAQALTNGNAISNGWLETPIRVIDAENIEEFDAASLPPENLEEFYGENVATLKSRDFQEIPPLSASRAPAPQAQ